MFHQTSECGAEYIIYTFNKSKTDHKPVIQWRYHKTLAELTSALDEAKSLFETQVFQKIEIKKRYFDPKRNRVIDKTYKIITAPQKRPYSTQLSLIIIGLFTGALFLYFI